jgi:uncharacterized protein YutE (UPF0331/DUF86 family)
MKEERRYPLIVIGYLIIPVLHENGLVEQPLLDALIKMAKFRNIVVYHCDKVDPSIVVGILHNNLKDFNRYKDAVVSFLKEHGTEK